MAQNNLCYNLPMSKHKDLRGLVNYEGDEGLVAMACRLLEHAVKEYKAGAENKLEEDIAQFTSQDKYAEHCEKASEAREDAEAFFIDPKSRFYFFCNVANMRGATFDPDVIREALGII